MPRPVVGALFKDVALILLLCVPFGLAGCGVSGSNSNKGVRDFFTPTDVSIIRHHVQLYRGSLRDFTVRLYAKNPKYEKDPSRQRQKIDSIFGQLPTGEQVYAFKPSHEILAAAFQGEVSEPDRVYLLSLGLWKGIQEAYHVRDEGVFFSGLQISLERLQRLHHNVSQVNWRLKTYKDKDGKLLFVTNEAGENGYINMGYEVIMTQILTRIEDDIIMRGGLPEKYIFSVSTMFLGIVI
ncbi:hypothetical protein [Thiovibrio frasassiensis]|uniref:Lipoprotein n=1 Tax=Thiovibrio frasassiensis TaxID=2984131 RepID=A0A9X4MJR8_9BACT|nr:hypothetical protein [Thiovibrio frasassiensis]MDG4476134.1 hypothetical protein [Thiovibrio frasassiensis]